MAEPASGDRCDDCLVDIELHDEHANGAGCLRPTDNLVGMVRISSVHRLCFSRIEVHLEGEEATTLSSGWTAPRTISRKLLNAATYPCISQGLSMDTEASKNVYSLPFFFVMPDGTEFTSISEHTLPPPFDASNALFSSWSPIPFPNISVSYFLQVILTYREPIGQSTTAIVTKPIKFLPYFEVPPPIDIDSFPGEFALTIERPLRRSIFHGRLGLAAISTKEPPPLTYLSDVAQASTKCELNISIECDHSALRWLRYATVEAHPVICAKTYFSSKRMPFAPAKSLITGRGPIRIHQDWLRLDSQKFQNFRWTYSPQNPLSNEVCGQDERNAPSPAEYNKLVSFLQSSNASSGSSEQRCPSKGSKAAGSQAGVWQASISVPITPPRRLQPSFRSHLIARSYSLLLHVSFGGVYTREIVLEAPLQVAYPRQSMPPLAIGDNLQPVSSGQCAAGRLNLHDNVSAPRKPPPGAPSEREFQLTKQTSESPPTYDMLMN